ncbi:hypothetical protein [uncultured Chryseobacterium sp.]|jgi:hypothetical protein|uniref:hypothetical protein n=1 Tax=uncultured Chryseobacterium sp. TaxID=259322 RepID=UPI00262C97D5|nr:hypothetical protein [uncultured Chryseobacterium sp.]
MKNLLITVLLLLLSNSCSEHQNKKNNIEKEKIKLETISEDQPLTDEYTLYADNKFDFNNKKLKEDLDKAIFQGDTIAYNSASKHYAVNGRYKEFLYYAILMAEKNNYRQAYWDISNILSFEKGHPLITNYGFTSIYGKYSMLKAYEMGDNGAKASVDFVYKQYGKAIPASTSVYCSK